MDTDEKEFLLKDFEHWADSYHRNEECGERRLSFFIGIVTATMAALGFLAKDGEGINFDNIRGIGCGAILVLVGFGILTLLRILRRNRATDGYLHAMGAIRARLASQPLVAVYTSKLARGRSLWTGGLAAFVAFLNSSLLGACVWLGTGEIGWSALTVVAAAVVHAVWLSTGAPGISRTFRPSVGLLIMDGRGQVLAMERQHPANAWQLPQGGIEDGEDPTSAAWRELYEETRLTDQHVTLVRAANHWIGYELPSELRSPKTGRGQVQKWFLFRSKEPFPASLIRDSEEVKRMEWRPLSRVVEEAADFRRPVYKALEVEFASELAEAGASEAPPTPA